MNRQPAPTIKPRTGIVGIEKAIQEKQRATDASISQAFQDLSKLMTMAKDMVSISKNISTRIKEKQGDITEDETIRFKSYLLSLGIDDPVTRESYKSESQYHKSLAKQLSDMLVEPIKEVGGMMQLTDAYCRVNRARGFELLSPDDLLQSCQLMERLRLPLRLRKFESGVQVLQLENHNDVSVVKATIELLKQNISMSAPELSQQLGISVILALERLTTTEKFGYAGQDTENHNNSRNNSRASTPLQYSYTELIETTIITESQTPLIEDISSEKIDVFHFKDPKFQLNSTPNKVVNKKRGWKSLKQIVTQERALPWPENTTHFCSINAPPTFKPFKKYSDISGLLPAYTDPQTKLNYATTEEYVTVRSLPSDLIAGYLALRRVNSAIP